MKRRTADPRNDSRPPDFFSADVGRARRFYLDLKPPPSQALTVVSGGLEYCRPDYKIRREKFPYFALEYVARGGGQLTLNGKIYPLFPGQIFSYGQDVPHEIAGSHRDPLVKYFVDFSGRKAANLLRDGELPIGTVSQVHPPSTLQAIFDELIENGLRVAPARAELCGKLLECLVLKVGGMRLPEGGAETLAFSTYQSCREHIERHFRRLRSLKQIAEECHADGPYLCRLFKRYDHQSPYRYLLRLKSNLAVELLQRPGSLVKEVAEEVGFDDPFHFSRLFKNILGISPAAFRQMQ